MKLAEIPVGDSAEVHYRKGRRAKVEVVERIEKKGRVNLLVGGGRSLSGNTEVTRSYRRLEPRIVYNNPADIPGNEWMED